jgi:broad specificity phosphatase PhoE
VILPPGNDGFGRHLRGYRPVGRRTAADGEGGVRVGERGPGPSVLWLVRHGESIGNVADARAHASGAGRLELDVRDPDVPLSDTGRSQAEALGRRLAALPEDDQPTAVLSSPFARALTTAQLATAGLPVRVRTDERLRERDFGAFDGMTGSGIREHFPDEARRRDLLGKFYYRPPGGESWADVALRLRSLLATEALRHDCDRLLVVAHQAVIMVFRYVLEELTEQQLLDIDKDQQVANTSLTRYDADADGTLHLASFNSVDHLVAESQQVTEEPDAAPGP